MVEIRAELREALEAKIAEVLPALTVRNGIFLAPTALRLLEEVDAVLPDAHKVKPGGDPSRRVKPLLIEMIDDHPVAEFIVDFLGLLLEQNGRFDEQAPTMRFDEILEPADLSELPPLIVDALQKLPHNYTVTFLLGGRLGALIPSGQREARINASMRLVRIDEQFREETPGAAGAAMLGSLASMFNSLSYWPIADGEVALEIEVSGFCARYGSTATLMEAMLQAKALFGLLIAIGLLAPENATRSGPARLGLIVGRNGSQDYVARRDLDHDTSFFLRSLSINPKHAGDAGLEAVTGSALGAAGKALAAGAEGKRLRLACRWFFDSSASSDDVTAYVQAMIVMETLLGELDPPDRNSISLGELLKNRCAYLLGKDRADREHILARFPVLYRLRSAIVHNGHHKLSSVERRQLYELRFYCASVIKAEARMLSR